MCGMLHTGTIALALGELTCEPIAFLRQGDGGTHNDTQ